MDADHSGGISRGEWEKKFGKGSGKDFDRYDKNHDGELDRGEWAGIERGKKNWGRAKGSLGVGGEKSFDQGRKSASFRNADGKITQKSWDDVRLDA